MEGGADLWGTFLWRGRVIERTEEWDEDDFILWLEEMDEEEEKEEEKGKDK